MEQVTHLSASDSAEELCYLSAGHVESPGGTLADLELWNRDDETVGTLDGVLIDPPARRVRYFVVRSTEPLADRFLVPADAIVRVEPEAHIARLEYSEEIPTFPFDPDATRPFSDDDALTAMFSH